jgi:hypothetical protein
VAIVIALGAGTAAVVATSDASDPSAPAVTSSESTPPGSTPARLGRALDGVDRAIDR